MIVATSFSEYLFILEFQDTVLDLEDQISSFSKKTLMKYKIRIFNY